MKPTMKPTRTLSKGRAALAVLVPALLLVGISTQPWATGEARDVLSRTVVSVTGGGGAPGVVGLAAVAVVAMLGLMTGGRVIRAISAGALVLSSLGALALVLLLVLRPVQAVASEVARELARTTAPEATGATTAWAWLGLVAALLLVAGATAAAVSSRTWAGLSGRYDREPAPDRGPRGQVRTTWDELSDGEDPTLRDAPDQT